jgi:hypothetical protein
MEYTRPVEEKNLAPIGNRAPTFQFLVRRYTDLAIQAPHIYPRIVVSTYRGVPSTRFTAPLFST